MDVNALSSIASDTSRPEDEREKDLTTLLGLGKATLPVKTKQRGKPPQTHIRDRLKPLEALLNQAGIFADSKDKRSWAERTEERVSKWLLQANLDRGAMPVDFLPHLMLPEKQFAYGVKDNGARCFLIILKGLLLFCIPFKKRMHKVIFIFENFFATQTQEWELAILDGELMLIPETSIQIPPSGQKHRALFMGNSCIYCDGHSVMDETLFRRWRLMQGVVRRLNEGRTVFEEIHFMFKELWINGVEFGKQISSREKRWIDTDEFKQQVLLGTKNKDDPAEGMVSLFNHFDDTGKEVARTATDGYLVYDLNAKYTDKNSILKEKHLSASCDFLVKEEFKDAKVYQAYLMSDNYLIYVGDIPKSIQPKFTDEYVRTADNKIFECLYSPKYGSWLLAIHRSDKTEPNWVKVMFDSQSQINADYSKDINIFFEMLVKQQRQRFGFQLGFQN